MNELNPTAGQGFDPMSAKGKPYAIEPQSNQTTIIYTVSFKEILERTYIASKTISHLPSSIGSQTLKVGKAQKLRNGNTVTLTQFAPYTNRKANYGDHSGLDIKLNYESSNPVLFLQSIEYPKGGNDASIYGAGQGKDPFYFSEYINQGKFEDRPGFPSTGGKPNSVETFNASLVIYEKKGDVYSAVGVLDYKFQVSYDSKGNTKSSKIIKQSFTDLSQKE